jgi:hypothetical protein
MAGIGVHVDVALDPHCQGADAADHRVEVGRFEPGGQAVADWLAPVSDRGAGLLTVYWLPPYAHELNPVEPVWSYLKRSLANLAKRNLAQLTVLVKTRLTRMQYRPACSRASSPAPASTSHPSAAPQLLMF